MTSMKRNTAIAEPSPKSLCVNAVRHIASAITFASRLRRLRRDRQDDVEDLQDVDHHRDEDDAEHRRQQRHGHAAEDLPLAGAVGARGLERVARDRGQAGRDHDHREAGPDPDVGDDDRGRDQLRAEPARRRRRASGRSSAPIAGPVGARLQVLEREAAVVARSSPRRPSCRSTSRRTTRDARQSELALLDLAGRAAAGLEVAPDDARDRSRRRLGLRRPAPRPSAPGPGGMPVSPSRATSARLERRLQHDALSAACPISFASRAARRRAAPAG